MPEIDEFDKRADELLKKHFGIITGCSATRDIAQALRDVHDRAVESSAKIVFDRYRLCQVVESEAQSLINEILRLKKSNS